VRKAKWGFIDKTGNEVIPYRFVQARSFSEGMAPVKDQTGWLFVDETGTTVPGLTGFEDAKNFSEGLAPVQVDGKWRFITPKGTQRFPQEFYWASSFSEHLAAVQQEENGKYGFIDRSGNYIIKPTLSEAKPFAGGLAAVFVNKRWGYLTKSGEIKIPAIYPLFADDFVGGLAAVSNPVDGAEMYINSDGQAQFFKSTNPAEIERGSGDYSMVALKVSSSPSNVNVYLIPAYIWDFGGQNQTPPARLDEPELKGYLKAHFEFLRGQTNLEARVIEQTYVALFVLGESIQRQKVDARIGDNSASASFDGK